MPRIVGPEETVEAVEDVELKDGRFRVFTR
jgi:hypothetical protein